MRFSGERSSTRGRRRRSSRRSSAQNKKPKKLASAGKNFDGKPLLKALAQREEAVRNGKLTTIVFIRDKNAKGQEVSGYLDYAHRLKTTDFEAVFDGKKSLLPKPGDLSFYNWETQTSTSHSTPNFQVISDDERGLMFKNKRDRKVIDVDPASRPGTTAQGSTSRQMSIGRWCYTITSVAGERSFGGEKWE